MTKSRGILAPRTMTAETLLPRREVEKRTGMSRSSIYARMKAGTFPRPVQDETTHSVWWVESEIAAWIAARIAARDQQAA